MCVVRNGSFFSQAAMEPATAVTPVDSAVNTDGSTVCQKVVAATIQNATDVAAAPLPAITFGEIVEAGSTTFFCELAAEPLGALTCPCCGAALAGFCGDATRFCRSLTSAGFAGDRPCRATITPIAWSCSSRARSASAAADGRAESSTSSLPARNPSRPAATAPAKISTTTDHAPICTASGA